MFPFWQSLNFEPLICFPLVFFVAVERKSSEVLAQVATAGLVSCHNIPSLVLQAKNEMKDRRITEDIAILSDVKVTYRISIPSSAS